MFGAASIGRSRPTAVRCCAAAAVLLACLLAATASSASAFADEAAEEKPITARTEVMGEGLGGLLPRLSDRARSVAEDLRLEVKFEKERRADAEAEAEAFAAMDAIGEVVAKARTSPDETIEVTKGSTPVKGNSNVRGGSLTIKGHKVRYIQGSSADITAPANSASTWLGNGSVNDGRNTYFIGHNPGVFSPVMDLEVGDRISVTDGAGHSRDYHVIDIMRLPKGSNYMQHRDRLAPGGESITLQCCVDGDEEVRCVMAR